MNGAGALIDDRDWFSWEGIARIRAQCEAQAESEGLAGLRLFMRGQELFNEALAAKPTYRERQRSWRAKIQPEHAASDPLREALQAIADGHNDPRTLAKQVLSQ